LLSFKENINRIIDEIGQLPSDFHGVGTMPVVVLKAMAEYCPDEIDYSAETGAGFTTLLLSHISRHHVVFALDYGRSVSTLRGSPLLNSSTVEFIEQPTQKSLPRYQFRDEYDLVLIDGPHGFPFPDMEYYYFYPHIKTGGLLLLDDIHIPTIYNLFQFLREDEMFELEGLVVDTAFFRRTAAEAFDAFGDNWSLQEYNASRFPIFKADQWQDWGKQYLRMVAAGNRGLVTTHDDAEPEVEKHTKPAAQLEEIHHSLLQRAIWTIRHEGLDSLLKKTRQWARNGNKEPRSGK
jgi:hypothetical protein